MKWLILLTLFGCAQITSLNMRKHQFGVLPTRIIWFQVAGLEAEHIAMLRFNQAAERRTSFEDSTCAGQSWGYNLYDLRPSAEASFLSQLTGKKNIRQSCEDAAHRPIWNYLATNAFHTGVLESGGSPAQSILRLNQCGEQGLAFLSPLYFWFRREPPKGATTFHYAEEIPARPNELFFDRSCGAAGCSSSIFDDVKAVYGRFQRVSGKHLLIVRDFTYLAALERKDFPRAREILADIDRAHAFALELTRQNPEQLVLLTTGESRFVDLPDQGKNWFTFERSGTGASAKRPQLLNLVLAHGARAENFCGIYEEAEVFERILSGPKQQGLELKLINPFR